MSSNNLYQIRLVQKSKDSWYWKIYKGSLLEFASPGLLLYFPNPVLASLDALMFAECMGIKIQPGQFPVEQEVKG